MAKSDRFEKGMVVRRKVLGDAYVDQAMQKADEFSMPLQDFVTENAWGTVWVRDGLTLKQRSLITVSAIIAMNRPHELKLHLRGAITNGVTQAELAATSQSVSCRESGCAALSSWRSIADSASIICFFDMSPRLLLSYSGSVA